MAYKSVGATTHYSISYDESLDTLLSKTDGEDRANALRKMCEQDFALMAGWFPGVTIKYSTPFEVRIEQGGGFHAQWGSHNNALLPISLFPSNGQALDVVRYLLVAEVTEMFMQSQNKGWYGEGCEGSNGEALSLFLGMHFLLNIGSRLNPGGITSLWLNAVGLSVTRYIAALPLDQRSVSIRTLIENGGRHTLRPTVKSDWHAGERPDWVNNTDKRDRGGNEKSGCAELFLWYLNVQLGFDINSIVAAAAPTLSGVYKTLTKDSVDPFPDFKQVLDSAFPATNPNGSARMSTVLGPNSDNPFPLPSPRRLSVTRYIAELSPDQRVDSIRILIAQGGKHTLRPTLNSNRRAALL